MVRWGVLLLLVPLVAAAPLPLPPAAVDFTVVEVDDDWINVTVNWTAAGLGAPAVQHDVHLASPLHVSVPLASAEVPATSVSFLRPSGREEVYFVTSTSANGARSGPSNPIVVGSYPHCTVIGWGIDPPGVYERVECLLPPPV